jgi:hypothetical protein
MLPRPWRAGLHRYRTREGAEDNRGTGTHQLREGHPGQRFGKKL